MTVEILYSPSATITGGGIDSSKFKEEFASGIIDGVNTEFTIPHSDIILNTLKIFRNGVYLKRDEDFVIVADSISLFVAPSVGEKLIATYIIN